MDEIFGKELVKVPLIKYFEIISPKQDDKINFDVIDGDKRNGIPFLGRSAANNGIVDYVVEKQDFVNTGNVITIALDGSTGSTFYQHHKFSSGQNIWILQHKEEYIKELTPEIAMFLITSIRIAVKDYTWNLSLTKSRLKNINIFLPLNDDESVDLVYIRQRMKKIRNIEMISKIQEERYE